jgi:hypothetical protein
MNAIESAIKDAIENGRWRPERYTKHRLMRLRKLALSPERANNPDPRNEAAVPAAGQSSAAGGSAEALGSKETSRGRRSGGLYYVSPSSLRAKLALFDMPTNPIVKRG